MSDLIGGRLYPTPKDGRPVKPQHKREKCCAVCGWPERMAVHIDNFDHPFQYLKYDHHGEEIVNNAEAAEILERHNRWRRGVDERQMPEMGNPTLIGQAIDVAVAALRELADADLRGRCETCNAPIEYGDDYHEWSDGVVTCKKHPPTAEEIAEGLKLMAEEAALDRAAGKEAGT